MLAIASAATAQDVPQLSVGRLADGEGPEIDGRVEDAVWSRAQPHTAFIQQEPNEGQPATERTDVRFLIDRATLYIAVICYDTAPGDIVVSESRRDASLTDTDSIEILLDTFDDGQNAFVFGTNPFGIEYDGQVMSEGQTSASGFVASGVGGSQRGQVRGFNANWDADWTVRARTTERGWEAEFAIPLKTLRYNFFSRRIGLSPGGQPIDIVGGGRLSGKLGGYNIGVLNLQTEEAVDRTGRTVAPGSNFTVARLQREVGRSTFGGVVVNRQGVGSSAPSDDFNRAYGLDLAWQASSNGKLFGFLARTDSPARKGGSDYAGRVYYSYANPVWSSALGYSQVGERFNPEVGFLQRQAYRRVESRYGLSYQPKRWPSIRRLVSTLNYNVYTDLDNRLESTFGHWHVFEIQPRQGGRIAYIMDIQQDRPRRPFTVYQDVAGRRVIIPAGEYASWNGGLEYESDPSAPVNIAIRSKNGRFYDGDHAGWELSLGMRLGARLISSAGWSRDNITLPFGSFTNDLIPLNVSYSFTSLASLQGLIQYNRQSSTLSSNIRLALLDRSGTGLFAVYNDRRDTSDVTSDTLLGRSFIVKYTRLLDF